MEDKALIGSLYWKYKLTQEKDGLTYWWYSIMTWLLTDRIKVSRFYPAQPVTHWELTLVEFLKTSYKEGNEYEKSF